MQMTQTASVHSGNLMRPWLTKRLFPRQLARRDALQAGARIGDRFTVSSLVGVGGFGFTYAAKDPKGGLFAVKECFPSSYCRRDGSAVGLKSATHEAKVTALLEQFRFEAEALAALDHPNVVSGGERIDANGTSYIAMSFVRGKHLNQLRQGLFPRLRERRQIRMAKELLLGLQHVHQGGYLHNDISPENVLCSATRKPVLIDFGTCSRIGEQAMTDADDNLMVVKPGYSPPEFYTSGVERTPQSDIYQLGATLVSLMIGERPPEGMQRLMTITRTGKDPIQLRSQSGGADSLRFVESLGIAMAIDPDARFASAKDWTNFLEN